ncbi:hypothetical protein ABIB40_002926 [Pedobacter sp. UYP30]|uniref:hypothetical protein n=1 Tax=Pedobacter sp. UYP30 TaxID=1756400 RepID=UPI0033922723
MINVDSYNKNAFEFYKKVCQKKRNPDVDPNYKNRLLELDVNIGQFFDNYDLAFSGNLLENLNPYGYVNPNADDLCKLYKYSSATLQKLKTIVTTTKNGRKVQCQNCTMNEVNSLDHLLPKEKFPEFAVNPKNLFPCCSKCNSYKGDLWRDNGVRTSLNLYIDSLPHVQYLFVNVEIGNSYMETDFFLDNKNGINEKLYELISSHYNNLHLLERFSEAADDVITSFKHIVESARDKLTLLETRHLSKSIIEKEKTAFGSNYWQSILKLALIDNDDFLIEFD